LHSAGDRCCRGDIIILRLFGTARVAALLAVSPLIHEPRWVGTDAPAESVLVLSKAGLSRDFGVTC
jgi:hypothetical protein